MGWIQGVWNGPFSFGSSSFTTTDRRIFDLWGAHPAAGLGAFMIFLGGEIFTAGQAGLPRKFRRIQTLFSGGKLRLAVALPKHLARDGHFSVKGSSNLTQNGMSVRYYQLPGQQASFAAPCPRPFLIKPASGSPRWQHFGEKLFQSSPEQPRPSILPSNIGEKLFQSRRNGTPVRYCESCDGKFFFFQRSPAQEIG